MRNHVQIVGALHIAMGALTMLGAIAVFVFLGMASGIVVSQGENEAAGIIGIVGLAIGSFLALLALPSLLGGWALLAGHPWGRPVVLILGALELFNIPLGTALGIYTFWALLREPEASLSGGSRYRSMT